MINQRIRVSFDPEMLCWKADTIEGKLKMTDITVPTPPAPPTNEPTLIETLNAKLHAAHLELNAAEQRVKDIEGEIDRVPAWAKDMTEAELQVKVGGWFK